MKPAKNESRISVVVLSKDEFDLDLTLELLRPQCETLSAQCVVVDASQGRLESIHASHQWTTWIDYTGPFWRSSTIPHQRNLGCRAATGDVIAFCDAGGEPSSNWLATITAPLLSKRFSLVCGPISAKGVGVYSLINDVEDGEVVSSASTANLAFLKSVFDEVDGFDERLFYGSDLDFAWRCGDAQILCFQVRDAGMVMDFGNLSLTMRRSWRYGRAWARLYGLHPERHLWMIRKSPERVVYPIWIMFGPISLIASVSRKLRWAPVAWIGLLGVPLIRNAKTPSPRLVVTDHIIGGASVMDETLRRIVGEAGPVVFVPGEKSPYLRNLAAALERQGTPITFWRGPTKSATLNILLGPIWMILMAWRGVKIVHIHWTYGFSRSSNKLFGLFFRWWFGIFLKVAEISTLKIIWTAHNVLPHEPVFDNDFAARKILVSHSDAVIALSPHSAQTLEQKFGIAEVNVIPHGPLTIPASPTGRTDARSALNVGTLPCFSFFGNLRPYKGIETLISAAEYIGPDIAVRIAGQGDSAFVANLTRMAKVASRAGANIELNPRWQSDEDIADLLAASDYCVFPFTRIDNSGSVILALGAGVPVIVPDLPSLHHIDSIGVIRYDAASPVRALAEAMNDVTRISQVKREEMSTASREWASRFSWDAIAEETSKIYAKAIRRK